MARTKQTLRVYTSCAHKALKPPLPTHKPHATKEKQIAPPQKRVKQATNQEMKVGKRKRSAAAAVEEKLVSSGAENLELAGDMGTVTPPSGTTSVTAPEAGEAVTTENPEKPAVMAAAVAPVSGAAPAV